MKKIINKKAKRLVLTCGVLALALFAPISNNAQPLQPMVTYAAEQSLPYSQRWETQANGDWKYKMDNGGYATGWVQDEVDKNWYLLSENGIMKSGVYKSYGRYYILSEIHDGHFGHLIKNGEVYKGVAIKADTSADYEGALSQESINALKAIGYSFESAPDISGTSHTTDGKVTVAENIHENNVTQENYHKKQVEIARESFEKYKDQLEEYYNNHDLVGYGREGWLYGYTDKQADNPGFSSDVFTDNSGKKLEGIGSANINDELRESININ